MRAKTLTTIVLFLLATICPPSLAAPPLTDRIPSDALIYIGWTGAQSMPGAFEASHLKAVLDESALPQLFDVLLPQLMVKVAPKDREAVEIMRLISAIGGPLWRHPSAVYFGGIDWTNGPPMPRLAILCDAGAEADGLLRELNRIIARAGQDGPPITARKYGSLVVVAIAPPAGVDQMFANPPAEALSKSPAFTTALEQVPGDGMAAVFIDVQGLVKQTDEAVQRIGEPQATALWPKIRDGLGLGGLRQAIFTSGFDGQDWCEQSFVGTDGGKSGLVSLFGAPPLSDDTLAVVPKTADSVTAGSFDLAALVRAARAGIESIDPNVADEFDRGVTMVNGLAGVDVQKELLDPLGEQWVMYTDRAVGGPGLLGAVIVNKLRDPAKFEAAMSTVAKRANQMMASAMKKQEITVQVRQTSTRGGVAMHYLAVPLVTPAWAVKDGNLFFAFYPQVIDSATSQIPTRGDSILQNPAFIAVQKRLGDHKASGVSFTNLPQSAGEGYAGLLAISRLYLGFADMMGVQTPAMVLPPLHKLLPHVAPLGAVSWSDPGGGWHFKSITPFPGAELLADSGMGTAIVGQSALITSILLPSLSRSRETANRVKCASNQRQIGQAILMYANEHRGKYPDDMGTLVKTEDIVVNVFICPSSNNALPPEVGQMTLDQRVAWVTEHSDFVYLGKGQTTAAPADRIILYEKPGAHDADGMNMLYGDGHVEFQHTAEAMRQIELQEKKGEQGL